MKKEENKLELFFPYYINQGRLLDIYAILNNGYSEYSELTTAISGEKTKSGKGEASISGGFKLLSLGCNASVNIDKTDSQSSENKEKKVQTITSILSIVKSTLAQKGYLHEIKDASDGQFVCLPVVLSINSIKSLLSETSELLNLCSTLKKTGFSPEVNSNKISDIEKVLNSIKILFNGEEILFEDKDYAIFGNIFENNLYQAVRSDIIGTKLNCLAQVKRTFPNGTELMKNTIFTKIKNNEIKTKFIQSLESALNNKDFEFEAIAKPNIFNKPVYQLEIIALYQQGDSNV